MFAGFFQQISLFNDEVQPNSKKRYPLLQYLRVNRCDPDITEGALCYINVEEIGRRKTLRV